MPPLRVLLPCVQENVFEDFDHYSARQGKDRLPALRQQERRAALVRLLCGNLQKERVKAPSKEALEMPPTRGRYRSVRPITDYEASETGGGTPQG